MITEKLKIMNKWRKRRLNPMRFIFARHRRNPVVRLVSRLARMIVKFNENEDVYMYRNGETWLMNHVALYFRDHCTVWDVGANVGEWLLNLRRGRQARKYMHLNLSEVTS